MSDKQTFDEIIDDIMHAAWRLRTIKQDLTVQPVASGWQPIKTCPKNKFVLFWDSKWRGSCFVGHRWDDGRIFDTSGYVSTQAFCWMPLPSPPEDMK